MSLFQCKNPKHAAYIHILAGKREEDRARKEILEQYWAIYEPYADTHFLEEIGINFYQRVWEMRLGVDLLAMGLKLEPTGDDGPDFVFEYKGKKIWIEAIVPEKGNTEDAVPEIEYRIAQEEPQKQIQLRYLNAIQSKYKQCYTKYLNSGLIGPHDCFVIAVNGHLVGALDIGDDFPLIVKCLYGIGDAYWIFDTASDSEELTEGGHNLQWSITKSSGSAVGCKSFIDKLYPGISGIIFSSFVLCKPVATYVIDDYIFVDNMTTKNKIPCNLFSDWPHFGEVNGYIKAYKPIDKH